MFLTSVGTKILTWQDLKVLFSKIKNSIVSSTANFILTVHNKWDTPISLWRTQKDFCTVFISGVTSLHIVDFRVPSLVVRNQNVRLECTYDMDGEILYSVKWYKDGQEFYRFVPRDHPQTQWFSQMGVTVDVSFLFFVPLFNKGVLLRSLHFFYNGLLIKCVCFMTMCESFGSPILLLYFNPLCWTP